MAQNYLDLMSPFGLLAPPDFWLADLLAFDRELVLFPSQKQPLYRLARRAHRTGGITARVFQGFGSMIHPDTKIMFDHHLVSVTTVPRDAIKAPCAILCASLAARDTWRHGTGEDAAAKALEQMEADEKAKAAREWKDEMTARAHASRAGFQYRTGARVSLIHPRPPLGATSPSTPLATAGSVSTKE